MAEISRLHRVVNGALRGVDLASNTLVVLDIKIGGGAGTTLTKAILDRLVTLQDGSDVDATYHTHDGRYYTETEIGSTANGEGASLVGIEDASSYYTGTNVEAALDELEAQIGGATSTTFDFSEANVLADNDSVYAALEKLDLRWGDLASTATSEGASLVGIEDSGAIFSATDVEGALAEVKGQSDALVSLSGVAALATDLGTFTGTTIADGRKIKEALQDLETFAENTRSIIENFEWQESVIDKDLTAPPGSPSTGDRYLIGTDTGASSATGAWAGQDGNIAEWDGAAWQFTTPTVGMFVAADDETDRLYLFGGTTWTERVFESTTASTGLTKVGFDIRLADASANGLTVSSGVFTVEVDDATIERSGAGANPLQVKADGIDGSHIRLTNDQWLRARNAGDSADVNILKVNASDEVEFALLPRLTSTITPTADTDLATKKYVDDQDAAQDDAAEITYTPSTLTDWDGDADPGNVDGALDQLADRLTAAEAGAVALTSEETPNAALGSGLRAVRWGVTDLDTPETAGQLYLADPTEESLAKSGGNKDPFHVIGVIDSDNTTGDQTVYRSGLMTVTGHGFPVGEPIFLDSSGAVTATPPSTAGEAVVRLGIVKDANTLDIKIGEPLVF